MKIKFCLIFSLLLFVQEIFFGYFLAEEEWTLERCISEALRRNPLILSALEEHRASLARINQAKALPQPFLEFDSDLQPTFLNFKASEESYLGLSQALEFPGKRALKGKIAFQESNELKVEIDLLKLDLVFRVKQAFYGLLLAQEKLRLAEQDLTLSKEFLKKAELRYESGDVGRVEPLRARVETAKAENAVKVALNEVELGKTSLNFLLARKKYEPLSIKGELRRAPLTLEREELRKIALAFRPEIKMIDHSLRKQELIKDLGYLSYLPDFQITISRHRLEGIPPTWDFRLSLPLPLFFWQPKRGEIAEALANIESLKKEKEHMENSILLEVEEAYTKAMSAIHQIELFENEILRQAEEVYNIFFFSYQEGEIGGIELIEARRTLIEARKTYLDALYNYSISLANLEKSLGFEFKGDQK